MLFFLFLGRHGAGDAVLVTLDQNTDRVRHELAGHLEDLVGQSGGDQADLGGGREVSVDVVDLFLEPLVQHLVGLVQNQHLDSPVKE